MGRGSCLGQARPGNELGSYGVAGGCSTGAGRPLPSGSFHVYWVLRTTVTAIALGAQVNN